MKRGLLPFICALPFTLLAGDHTGSPNRDKSGYAGKLHNAPVVTIDHLSVNEADGAATLTVRLSRPADAPVRIRYKTEDGTARHPRDYIKESGVIIIPAGRLTANIDIRIIKDNRTESTEYFRVHIRLGRHEHDARIGHAIARVTINDENPVNRTSYVELNNLVVVYTNTNGGTIDDTSKLGPALKQASDFYWRHSRMGLNIKWTVYVIDNYLDRVHASGQVRLWEVEADLKNRAFDVDPYDAVVAVVRGGAALAWGVDWNIDNPLEGAAFLQVPWWDEHYLFSWFFVHEFHHTLDELSYFSGHPDYPYNHPSVARSLNEFIPHSGSNWDLNAGILHFWDRQHWFDLTKPRSLPGNVTRSGWGSIKFAFDNDLDTIPDNDTAVPLDEKRFGSNRYKKDSDADGLTDLQESIAGIFLHTDPVCKDSDDDGMPDGEDTEPLYPINTMIPLTNPSLGDDITEWPFAGHYYFNQPNNASSSLYLTYTNNYNTRNYFYIGFKVPFQMTSCRLVIDVNNDGIFYGSDNYEIIMNGNTVEAVNLLDAASSPPNDIVTPVSPLYFAGVLKNGAGWSSYQLVLPLAMRAGDRRGVYIEIPGFGNGTMFELDDFISVTAAEGQSGQVTQGKKAEVGESTNGPRLRQLNAAVYPNPAAHSFVLQWQDNGQPVKISFTDATGRLIETKTAFKTNTLPAGAGWKPGLYYAEFLRGNERVVLKLVKQ